MNDGSVTPTSLVHALNLGQLDCCRLWGLDGSVHDGFMGLVSCFDQLGLQVPVDQPFRCGGQVGSYDREAGFLVDSTPKTPEPLKTCTPAL